MEDDGPFLADIILHSNKSSKNVFLEFPSICDEFVHVPDLTVNLSLDLGAGVGTLLRAGALVEFSAGCMLAVFVAVD